MSHDNQREHIDLHSHLLPGVDDGCRSLKESLASVRRLSEAGFLGSYCTPHVWPELYPENTPEMIAQRVAALRARVAEAGLDYDLWPGGEVRIAPRITDWLTQHGVPTLGNSRHVLIDYWGRDWPMFADVLVDWLIAREYHPVLAHPERMGLEDEELERIVDSLISRGVWLQGNLRSLAGGEGPEARKQLEWLLERKLVDVLATDAHGPGDLDSRLAGIDVLYGLKGREAAQALLRPGLSAAA